MGALMMMLTTIGLDLAKSVFQVHGTDERGKAILRKTLKRAEVVKFFANLPGCLIGMEACASAHGAGQSDPWSAERVRGGHPKMHHVP
jgi:transposase